MQKDEEIRIYLHDKEPGVAILNKNDYYFELDTIIQNHSKLVKVNLDPEKNHFVVAKKAQLDIM